MVLSVLASLKKKKKRRKTSCTNHTTTRILCPSLLANFVHKLSLVNVAPPPFLPSTLGAIFVAIKNKAVVLLEIHFVYGLFGHFGCEVKEMIFQKPFDFSLPPKMVRV